MPGDMSMYACENQPVSDMIQIDTIGSGVDFFINQVRREVKYGTDFIKIFLSGSFLSPDGGQRSAILTEMNCALSSRRLTTWANR